MDWQASHLTLYFMRNYNYVVLQEVVGDCVGLGTRPKTGQIVGLMASTSRLRSMFLMTRWLQHVKTRIRLCTLSPTCT